MQKRIQDDLTCFRVESKVAFLIKSPCGIRESVLSWLPKQAKSAPEDETFNPHPQRGYDEQIIVFHPCFIQLKMQVTK